MTTYAYDTYPTGAGYGYRLYADGALWVVQPYPRGAAGTAPFATVEAAEAEAIAALAEYTAPPPEPPPGEPGV